jgi:hypothetical protein
MRAARRFLVTSALGALALLGCSEMDSDSDPFTVTFSGTPPSGGEPVRLDEAAVVLHGLSIGDCATSCSTSAFGADVLIAGDLDADGFDDTLFLVPHYHQKDPVAPRGGIYVLYGRPTWADDPTFEPDAILAGDSLPVAGTSALAGAGDVDGDGYADFLVGANRSTCDDPTAPSLGGVHLVHGGPDRLSGIRTITEVASTFVETVCTGLGVAVASAGDLDGDGYSDFVAGSAPSYDPPTDYRGDGRVFLFYGGPERRPAMSSITSADATLRGRAGTAGFGRGVAPAGDIDGDGDTEMFIAEREIVASSPGDAAESAVYLVAGGPRLAGDIDATTAPGITTFSGFGLHGVGSVGLGDLDEDGLDDVALTGWAGGAGLAGGDVSAFLFYGRPGGLGSSVLVTSPDVILRVPSDRDPDDLQAMPIDAADLDGDGHRDILVGDTWIGDYRGGAHLITGTGARWTGDFPLADIATTYLGSEQFPFYMTEYEETYPVPEHAGWDVAGGGDVDGDGKADMIVGAPGSDFSFGRAYILR